MNSFPKLSNIFESLVASIGITVVIGFFILGLIIVLAFLFARVKLFIKCGQPWWKAFVPFYSGYIFIVKICGLHWAWFAGMLVISFFSLESAIANILRLFVYAMSYYNLALKCGRDPIPSMIFGALFPNIVDMVYAFGSAQYSENVYVKESGVF